MTTKSDRLRSARERAGFATAADAARAMGITPATYTHHENGTRGYDETAAAQYGRRFGVSAEWLIFGGKDSGDSWFLPATSLPVLGEVKAGSWLEIEEQPPPDENIPVAPDPRFSVAPQFALRVVGTSMNKVAIPGQFVIVASWADLGAELRDGDLVVVRRVRAMTYEVTMKRARFNKGAWELWPESTDPRYQQPLMLQDGDRDVAVIIIGKVIGIYAPL